MKSPLKFPFLMALAATAVLSAHNATANVVLTSAVSAPVPGLEDPNYLLTGGNIGSYPYNQGYSDKGLGQSFTIAGSGSFTLDSFSLKGAGSFGGSVQTGTWGVRISEFSLDGTTLTPLLTFTGIANPVDPLTGTEWLTWNFTGPEALTLTAGVTYAVQVLATDGYYGFTGDSASPYTGGTAFNTGGSYSFGSTSVSAFGYDQTFVANVSAIPEPVTVPLLLGGLGVAFLRRFRRKA